jgi:hypothetical protein
LVLLGPALAYYWLQSVIRRSGNQSQISIIYHNATSRKGVAALVVYSAAVPISYFAPAIGISMAGLVAIFWILPWGPLDRLFLRCPGPEGQ